MLPIVPTQVMLRGNVGSLDAPRAAQLFNFGRRGQGIAVRGSYKWSEKNQQKIVEANGWYARSAHCAHTGHVKGKCVFSGRS